MPQPYEKVTLSKKKIIINNFLGGISWGLGATIGLALVLMIISFILSQLDFIPIVGKFVAEVASYMDTTKN